MALPQQVSPPQIALSSAPPSGVIGAEVVAVPLLPAFGDPDGGRDHGRDGGAGGEPPVPALGPGAAELLDELDVDLFTLLEHHKATGRVGEIVELPVLDGSTLNNGSLRSILLVGVGGGQPVDLRRAAAALARRVRGRETVATSLAALSDDSGLRAVVEGLVLGSFGFHRRSAGAKEQPVSRVVLAGLTDPDQREAALDRALAVAGAGWTSRTLALTPSNEKNPQWLADRAAEMADRHGLGFRVWDEKQLAADGFGGIVAVGQGSATPPRLLQLEYTPAGSGRAARRAPHVVLVGKGITFDSGGLSIKPAEAMATMKRDMTGGGVVMAVMAALADVDCPVRVTGLVAAAENAVSGNAVRPGDVVRHYGGRTSEVRNTDAEGRLVLADAMAYAAAELTPDVLVDVATLTGAMKVALGQRTGGIFANDDALADLLVTAGRAAGEPLWRMPLVEDYEELLKSEVADADNAAGGPGALTAALFLQHFAGGVPWAHLDVASVGDSPVDAYEWTTGATGFGARALLHWLELREPLAGVGS